MKIFARAAIWPIAIALACASSAWAAPPKPVATPSGYVPQSAVAYGEPGQPATPVTPDTPLPIICITGCSGSGGGGSGGPTSIADGADQALGAKSDSAWSGTGNASLIAIMKAVRGQLAAPLSVTGTFWPATQPVSAAALPLPSGAATAAAQATGNGSLAAIYAGLGAAADASCATDAGACSQIALLKRQNERLTAAVSALTTANGHLATIAETAGSTEPAETQLSPSTPYFNAAAGETKYLVASGAVVLTDYFVENPDPAAKAYLQFFNAASAGAVTLGTTTPVRSIGLSAGEKANLSGLALVFPLGLVVAGTTTATGASAPATGLVVNLGYRGN
jgi:hypothetical protein